MDIVIRDPSAATSSPKYLFNGVTHLANGTITDGCGNTYARDAVVEVTVAVTDSIHFITVLVAQLRIVLTVNCCGGQKKADSRQDLLFDELLILLHLLVTKCDYRLRMTTVHEPKDKKNYQRYSYDDTGAA